LGELKKDQLDPPGRDCHEPQGLKAILYGGLHSAARHRRNPKVIGDRVVTPQDAGTCSGRCDGAEQRDPGLHQEARKSISQRDGHARLTDQRGASDEYCRDDHMAGLLGTQVATEKHGRRYRQGGGGHVGHEGERMLKILDIEHSHRRAHCSDGAIRARFAQQCVRRDQAGETSHEGGDPQGLE